MTNNLQKFSELSEKSNTSFFLNFKYFFRDPVFSEFCKYRWCENLEDSFCALNNMIAFETKADLLNSYFFSKELMKETAMWSYKELFNSFIYFHIVDILSQGEKKLKSFHWKTIFDFALHKVMSFLIF
jgi:hypothetical protein